MGTTEAIVGGIRGQKPVDKGVQPVRSLPKDAATQKRPWINPFTFPVSWKQRTYLFDFSTGCVNICAEDWDIKRNKEGDAVSAVAISGTRQNPSKFPELTYDETEALFVEAEFRTEPLKASFARLYKSRLTPDEQTKLALAPSVYPNLDMYQRKEEVEPANKQKADEFWNNLGLGD